MFIRKNIFLSDCKLQLQYKEQKVIVLFDREDFEKINKLHWRVSKKKSKLYVCTGQNKNGEKIIYLHNYLMNYNPTVGYEVDHINGNSLDNRKENLRIVTRQENVQNSNVRKDNKTTGIRGVSFNSKQKEFVVDFYIKKKRFHFKGFKNIEEAIYLRYLCEKELSTSIVITNNIDIKNIIEKIPQQTKENIEKYFRSKIL